MGRDIGHYKLSVMGGGGGGGGGGVCIKLLK